jgi:hypothetical protein
MSHALTIFILLSLFGFLQFIQHHSFAHAARLTGFAVSSFETVLEALHAALVEAAATMNTTDERADIAERSCLRVDFGADDWHVEGMVIVGAHISRVTWERRLTGASNGRDGDGG